MAIDNEQLARAIGAMYNTTNGGDGDWTDTDEAIQQAALKLWESHTCSDEEAAVLLYKHTPLGIEEVAFFLDVDEATVTAAIAEDKKRLLKAARYSPGWAAEMAADAHWLAELQEFMRDEEQGGQKW